LERAAVKNENFDTVGADQRYRQVFQEFDLDVDALDPEKAAERIRDSAIRRQLVAALDDWLVANTVSRRTGGARLLAVLEEADPDKWRNQVRKASRSRDLTLVHDLERDANLLEQPPATILLLGQMLAREGDISRSVAVLRSAQQRHPNHFWINHNLAFHLMQLQPPQAGAAVGYYRAALALRHDSPGVHLNLGQALREQRDLEGATAAFQKAISLKSDYAMAHYNLGITRFSQSDWTGAAAAYQKAIDLKPGNYKAYGNLGLALRAQGNRVAAIAACRKAVELVPLSEVDNQALAYNNLGLVLLEHGDRREAIVALEKAIDLKPDYADAHYYLGQTLRALGKRAAALAAYQKATLHKPDYAEAYSNIGGALSEMGRKKEALVALDKAIEYKPDLIEAHFNRGHVLLALRNLPGALAAFRKAVEYKPDFGEAHLGVGLVLEAKGDRTAAIAAFKRAVLYKPKFADAHYNLGTCLRVVGDQAGAMTALKKAVELNPNYAEAQCNLGLTLMDQGDFRPAREALRRGHELGARRPNWNPNSAEWLRQCERFVELEDQLPDVLSGKAPPPSPGVKLELGQMCMFKRLYQTATRFYEEAFTEQPRLLARARFAAACSGAQAGCGQGREETKPDAPESERLRTLALGWLREELNALAGKWDTNSQSVKQQLKFWQGLALLASVREPDPLAKLPSAEQTEWRRLWADVARILESGPGQKN
jgi:tetratricopeptide (TPR) repeat protein